MFEAVTNMRKGLRGLGKTSDWFKYMLTEHDLVNSSSVDVVADKDNVLGSYQIQAQEKAQFGYGRAENPQNQGYLYVKIQNSTPTQLHGKINLVVTDANNRQRQVVFSQRTEELDGSLTDKQEKEPMPNIPVTASEDDRLVIEFNPDSTDTVSRSDSIIHVPLSRTYTGSIR